MILRASIPGWLACAAVVSLSACGETAPPPRDPPLVADPPQGQTGPVADDGAVQTELERGMAFLKAEKFAEAKGHFEKAIAIKPSAVAWANLGVACEKTGDKAGAEKAYKGALAIDAGLADAAGNLAALYLDEPPRPDEAIAVLKAAIAKTPDPKLYQNLGYALGVKGDVEGASKVYEAALARGENAQIRFAYGSMLFDQKQVEKAAEQLKKAIDGAKGDAAMLTSMGVMLSFAKAYGDCVRAFDLAMKIKPSPEAIVRRGTCKHELKDEPGAQADYEEALKLDPSYAAGHYYLALSHKVQKNKLKAITELEKAIKLGAGKPIGKLAQQQFDEMTKKKK